eukprot:2431594-Pyramimonas_sp.AAC.1
MLVTRAHAQCHIEGPRKSNLTPLSKANLRHSSTAGNLRRCGLKANTRAVKYLGKSKDTKRLDISTSLRLTRSAREGATGHHQKAASRSSTVKAVSSNLERPTLVKSTRDGPLAGKVGLRVLALQSD